MPSEQKKLMICRVIEPWYQLIKTSYETNGAADLNIWFPAGQNNAEFKQCNPGNLCLLALRGNDGTLAIVGGGFLLGLSRLTKETAWARYGFRNGVANAAEFTQRIKALGGDPDQPLECTELCGIFIFSPTTALRIPGSMAADLARADCTVLSEDEPLARYLGKIALQRRLPEQLGVSGNVWPGIYIMAAQHRLTRFLPNFTARLLALYHNRCAISGCTTRPALEAAHIKTFFDENFEHDDNGIVMRADLHKLFSAGYLTLEYRNRDTVVVKISRTLAESEHQFYLDYDGARLQLPDKRAAWPNPDYLQWHQRIRFENWLKYSGMTPHGS